MMGGTKGVKSDIELRAYYSLTGLYETSPCSGGGSPFFHVKWAACCGAGTKPAAAGGGASQYNQFIRIRMIVQCLSARFGASYA